MEEFREKIKLDNITIAISAFVLTCFCALMAMSEAGIIPITPVGGDAHWASMWRGFIVGAACGLLLMMIFGLVRNIRALQSEKELKKAYVKANDERQIQIWTSARAAAYQAFLILGIVAVVVAGYFSMIVSITIIVCITLASFIGLGFKLYYSRKY